MPELKKLKTIPVWFFDTEGNPHIKMGADGSGNPKLEFLDATGKETTICLTHLLKRYLLCLSFFMGLSFPLLLS